ncbi:MAG: hypothetical protein AB7E55_35015, partial [Pigmentiphaga sp.]
APHDRVGAVAGERFVILPGHHRANISGRSAAWKAPFAPKINRIMRLFFALGCWGKPFAGPR